ncbi:MAG: DUF1294 domain-containing protein [Lachnospiraceae bacterium]|nr:DUF1294 domain-containing protein [Lachnospiraceae bacterium]
MQEVIQVLILYVIIINAAGFLAMGIDKRRSRSRRKWRISEAAMFTVALFGGAPGCIAGMYLFRHKTMKPAFQYGMPAILVIQVVAILIILFLSPLKFRIM